VPTGLDDDGGVAWREFRFAFQSEISNVKLFRELLYANGKRSCGTHGDGVIRAVGKRARLHSAHHSEGVLIRTALRWQGLVRWHSKWLWQNVVNTHVDAHATLSCREKRGRDLSFHLSFFLTAAVTVALQHQSRGKSPDQEPSLLGLNPGAGAVTGRLARQVSPKRRGTTSL